MWNMSIYGWTYIRKNRPIRTVEPDAVPLARCNDSLVEIFEVRVNRSYRRITLVRYSDDHVKSDKSLVWRHPIPVNLRGLSSELSAVPTLNEASNRWTHENAKTFAGAVVLQYAHGNAVC